MFRVVIIEDEKPAMELMKMLISRNGNYNIVGAYNSPLDALEQLPHLEMDIVFIDIEMPKMNGLELALKIMEASEQTAIVFTTAYEQYALSAFDVHALDYVLKPITSSAIERVTNRLRARVTKDFSTKLVHFRPIIRCLGSFELRNTEGFLLRFRTQKVEEFLAYLLCYPERDINKWLLTDLIWPEMSEKRAISNLHTTVYLLKKLLKDNRLPMDIGKTKEGYILTLGEVDYDYLTYMNYEVALANGTLRSEQAEVLRDYYRGPLLDGKSYLWKISLVEKLRKMYTGVVRRLVEADFTQKQLDRAEGRLNAFLEIYPHNKEMNLMVTKMYEERGLSEQAADHYARYERIYCEEIMDDLIIKR
jgi:two-component system LytT family response regulator